MCSDYRQHRLEASAPAWFGRIWRQMKVSVILYMTRLTLLQLHPFLHMGQQGELDRGNVGKQDWRNSLSLSYSVPCRRFETTFSITNSMSCQIGNELWTCVPKSNLKLLTFEISKNAVFVRISFHGGGLSNFDRM